MKKIAVIGGGMAGAAAGFKLQQLGYAVTVFERNDYIGGRVKSQIIDDITIELGAGFMTASYKNLRAFLHQQKLEELLYKPGGQAALVYDGRLHDITVRNLLGGQILSWPAKWQGMQLLVKTFAAGPLLDVRQPWQPVKYDVESITDYFQTTAGTELVERILQPVLSGYFYWTPEQTSLAVLLQICKAILKSQAQRLQGGWQQLPVQAVSNCEVRLGEVVAEVRELPNRRWNVVTAKGSRTFDGIICATTATQVPKLLPHLTARQRVFFDSITYSATVLLAQTYAKDQVRGGKNISFPRRENSDLAAITTQSAGRGVMKLYASGQRAKSLAAATDQAITAKLQAAMEPVRTALLAPQAQPETSYIQRWQEALPIFEPGHIAKLAEFESGGIEDPKQNIAFAGDYLGGPFMEGAFTSGLRAAERLQQRLQHRVSGYR